MGLRGLFIGIDHHASNHINQLAFAKRDAIALHALFTDTLGKGGILLTDEEATRTSIERYLKELTTVSREDIVVITFSGHGTQTHELVAYDADPGDLPASCLSLSGLTDVIGRVTARQTICILDCCFSGGIGAKVLRVESVPRNLASTESYIEHLSGRGRLILTASTAAEPAWENHKLGHGLLTYYLLEALQGAEEVRQAGKISVYKLLEYVTQRVISGSKQLGKLQHPCLRGELDGELTWPIFKPGPIFAATFPEHTRVPVSKNIGSLSAYGFPEGLLHAWAGSIPELNQLQVDAINEFHLLDGDNLVVSAPTSSGKTMVGELAALKGSLERKRAFFLLPMRALVGDKYEHFNRTYGEFGLKTIRATGEISDDIPALMRGQYDICLMTYEKFTALVLGNSHILDQVGTIIVDEVQMVADETRGANLEFLLTLFKIRRNQGSQPQLVLLSAVIGDTNGLERWLGARLLRRNDRPVPLSEGVICADGSFRYLNPSGEEKRERYIERNWGKGTSQDWVIPLVRKLMGEGKQVIVFRETKGLTTGCAAYLARDLGLRAAQGALDSLPKGDLSKAAEALRNVLTGGVAFHNADLDREERRVIEEKYREPDSTLRVIVATTTLAMGVNTPAAAVVVVGLDHPGSKPYSVAEYKNMVGRAGRLGYAEEGVSFTIAISEHDEHRIWTQYVQGTIEDLQSRFLDSDPRSLIVRVLASVPGGAGLSGEEIVAFVESSFGAFQQSQISHNWKWGQDQLQHSLQELQAHDLVRPDGGRFHLTPLGRLGGEAGVEVESIIRLVEALRGLNASEINLATLIATTQLTVELDQMLFPLNRSSTEKEPQQWVRELANQNVPTSLLSLIRHRISDQHQGTLRAKKAVACLLRMTDRPLSEIEATMTRFGGGFGGAAGAIRAVASRTCDLLSTVVGVAELIHPGIELSDLQKRILVRLELGLPSASFEIAEFTGSRLARRDYLRLLASGLSSIEAIQASDDRSLLLAVDGDKEKLAVLRTAVQSHEYRRTEEAGQAPILPPPEE